MNIHVRIENYFYQNTGEKYEGWFRIKIKNPIQSYPLKMAYTPTKIILDFYKI
jgi:hypothetical protein